MTSGGDWIPALAALGRVGFSLTAAATLVPPAETMAIVGKRGYNVEGARVDLSAQVAAALTGTRLVLCTGSVWCVRFITTMACPDGQSFRVRVSTGMCAWDFWML